MLALTVNHVKAQKAPTESQVKAAFLYNFTKFITWPSSAFNTSNAPFVIGVVGHDPFGSYLDELVEGESVNDRPIVIKRIANPRDAGSCHLLYINGNESSSKIKQVLAMVDSRHVLTVSDAGNFMKIGGEIRFYNDDNKIRVEINMNAAKASQLEISSKLLRIAKLW